jgi:OOP family OmpA-OmpF porin
MKTKALAALLLGVASTLLSLPAAAQYSLGEEPGFYAGATVGINGDDETAWRLLVGYQANRNFALELGYHDLGKHNIAGFPLESDAVEVLGVGRLPLNEQAALYAKLGGYRSTSKGGGANERQLDLTFGGGFEYALSQTLAARAEWQRYRAMGGGAIGQTADLDVYSVGAIYRFR